MGTLAGVVHGGSQKTHGLSIRLFFFFICSSCKVPITGNAGKTEEIFSFRVLRLEEDGLCMEAAFFFSEGMGRFFSLSICGELVLQKLPHQFASG